MSDAPARMLAEAIEREAEAAAGAVRARRAVDALLARPTAVVAATPEPARLLTSGELAKALGVSVATVRRLDPPAVIVGDASSKRFDLVVVRAFLAAREPKATTPARRSTADDVDVDAAVRAGGLRAVAPCVREVVASAA